MSGPLSSMWVAHEQPERPFEYGMWLCECHGCLVALRAEAAERPGTLLVLKTCFDRVSATVELALAVIEVDGSLGGLLSVPGDYIREVFVAPAGCTAEKPGGKRATWVTKHD